MVEKIKPTNVDVKGLEAPDSSFERRMEEVGGDPRSLATIAEMKAQGFPMEDSEIYPIPKTIHRGEE